MAISIDPPPPPSPPPPASCCDVIATAPASCFLTTEDGSILLVPPPNPLTVQLFPVLDPATGGWSLATRQQVIRHLGLEPVLRALRMGHLLEPDK